MDNIENTQAPKSNDTNETPVRKRGTVNNFGFLNENGITFIKNDLGLSMSTVHLGRCVNHYRSVERRNPTIDELYFLDAFVSTNGIKADNLALTAFESGSRYIFNTFKDLELRHAQLFKSSGGLMTYDDMMRTGFKVTDVLGKPRILDDNEVVQFASDEQTVEYGVYIEKADIAGEFRHCLLNQVKPFKEKGDDLAVMIYSEVEDADKTYKIISEYTRHGIIRVHRSMRSEGVVHSLMKLFNRGVFVAFDSFPVGMFQETDELCRPFNRTFYIARISRKDLEFFKRECTRLGVKCCMIGYGVGDSVFKIGRRDHSVIFPINRLLLERLHIPMTTESKLDGTPSKDINGDTDAVKSDRLDLFKVSSTGKDTFFGTLNALLGAVGTAVAKGYGLDEIELASVLKLPVFDGEKYNNGGYPGYALACYRVVSELGLNGDGCCVTDASLQDAVLESLIYAKAKSHSDHTPFSEASGNVYLLAPMTEDDGTVSFAQIRGLIEYVTRLNRSGAARYVRFVGGINLGDIIDGVASKCAGLVVDPMLDRTHKTPFAFLVDTNGKLNGKLLAYYTDIQS